MGWESTTVKGVVSPTYTFALEVITKVGFGC